MFNNFLFLFFYVVFFIVKKFFKCLYENDKMYWVNECIIIPMVILMIIRYLKLLYSVKMYADSNKNFNKKYKINLKFSEKKINFVVSIL